MDEITSTSVYASANSREIIGASPMPRTTDAMPRQVKVIPLQHPSTAVSTPSSSSSSSWDNNMVFARWRSRLKRMTWLDWIEMFLPCSRWIRTYNWREYLKIDLVAGIIVRRYPFRFEGSNRSSNFHDRSSLFYLGCILFLLKLRERRIDWGRGRGRGKMKKLTWIIIIIIIFSVTYDVVKPRRIAVNGVGRNAEGRPQLIKFISLCHNRIRE